MSRPLTEALTRKAIHWLGAGAFSRDTPTFRQAFGDDFADMLIAEANESRALRNMGPNPQRVQGETAFFEDKQWYALDTCRERVIGELGITTRERMAKTRSAKPKGRKTASRKTTGRSERPRGFRGLSVHVGLNAVDPKHYAGWSGDLVACEFDANDMAALARAQEIKPTVLLTKRATRANVFKAIRAAAKTLRKGDLLFLSYSGHGGQIPDVSGEEPDKKDETWCLYDGELIDDEVFSELSNFADGVRIIVLSDSCHSGSVVRARVPETVAGTGRSKMMPPSVAMRTYTQNKAFYDRLQKEMADNVGRQSRAADPDAALAQLHATGSARLTGIAGKVKASVILISGCQDNQTSMDGDHNGAFTEQLLRVWADGRFDPKHGTYVNFHATIKAGMPSTQTPNLFTLGPVATFSKQRPFTI